MNTTQEAYRPVEQEFLQLARKKETLARELKQADRELAEIMRRLPLGWMFQDPEDGTVYQIIAPSGTFVDFRNIDYTRTRKEGESRGTLSVKAAQEAGFKVKEVEKT